MIPLYRINYGNGQVSQAIHSLRAAAAELAQEDAFAFIERYELNGGEEPGEWFPVQRAKVEGQ